jgi:hypothetical protein
VTQIGDEEQDSKNRTRRSERTKMTNVEDDERRR